MSSATASTGEAAAERTEARQAWLAYGALGVAVFCIIWSVIFVRWAGVPGAASGFYRVFIASLVLVPAWLATRRGRPAPDRRTVGLALAGGVFFALDLGLYNTAILMTSATAVSLLGNAAPIFVGLGTWLLFRERPGRSFWIGLALAIAGCTAIVLSDAARAGANGTGGNHVQGDVIAVIAAVFFAAYLMMTARVRASMDTLTFSTLAITGSVVTLFVGCLLLGVPLTGYSTRTWAALVGLGLFTQALGYFALTYALGHLPATVGSVGLLAQVPLTALLAVPLLGEPITLTQVAGGALVLAGIHVVNRTANV